MKETAFSKLKEIGHSGESYGDSLRQALILAQPSQPLQIIECIAGSPRTEVLRKKYKLPEGIIYEIAPVSDDKEPLVFSDALIIPPNVDENTGQPLIVVDTPITITNTDQDDDSVAAWESVCFASLNTLGAVSLHKNNLTLKIAGGHLGSAFDGSSIHGTEAKIFLNDTIVDGGIQMEGGRIVIQGGSVGENSRGESFRMSTEKPVIVCQDVNFPLCKEGETPRFAHKQVLIKENSDCGKVVTQEELSAVTASFRLEDIMVP